MSATTFTSTGAKATTPAKLAKSVFDVEVTNHDLLKQAYLAYLANGRENFAVTKTRGLVSGGGKKPWKQKGTGRARFGSSRNPIWRGGGIAFGPTGEENYSRRLSVVMKRQATRQALSLANKAGKILVLETLNFKDGKVKPIAQLLTKIGATGSTLLVVDKKDDLTTRATNNLPNVIVVQDRYLNVYDVLNADHIVISAVCLSEIDKWLGASAPKTSQKADKETK